MVCGKRLEEGRRKRGDACIHHACVLLYSKHYHTAKKEASAAGTASLVPYPLAFFLAHPFLPEAVCPAPARVGGRKPRKATAHLLARSPTERLLVGEELAEKLRVGWPGSLRL